MRQHQKAPSESTSVLCHAIQTFMYVFLFLTALLPIIYGLGSSQPHQPVSHPRHQIFKSSSQQQVIKDLSKKKYRHTIITGKQQEGLFEFLQFYANERSQKGKSVVVKKNDEQTLDIVFREMKNYLEDYLNIEERTKRIEWVFIIKNGDIPVEEIQSTLNRHPNHRILVGTINEQTDIEGFQNYQYPGVDHKEMTVVLASQFQIPEQEAALLVRYYQSIPEIFVNLNVDTYSHEEHLGQFHSELSGLSERQLEILEGLCEEGKVKLRTKQNMQNLQKVGIIPYYCTAYWGNKLNILNYELYSHQQCKHKTIPHKILYKIQAEEQAERESSDSGNNRKKKTSKK